MKQHAVAALSLIVLTSVWSTASPMTQVQVDSKSDARISIIPVDAEHRSAVPQGVPESVPLGAFVLVNHTKTHVTAVSVRWTYTDADEVFRQRGLNCDRYVFSPLNVIVKAGDFSLITPYGCTSNEMLDLLQTGGVLGSPLTVRNGRPLIVKPGETLHIYLDSVIFEDGQIWGPDTVGYYRQIQDRYSVVESFLSEVRAGKSKGETLSATIARLREDSKSTHDKHSARRAYYVGLLHRSPNPEGTLRQLENQVAPPNFRHLEELQ